MDTLKTGAYQSNGSLPKSRAWGLALSGSLLAITGVAMIAFRYGIPSRDPFTAYPTQLWPWLLVFHVFPAPVFLFYLGSVWWPHLVRHWRNRKRRVSGGTMVFFVLVMAVSGYLLYFIGSQPWLEFGRVTHAVTGVIALVLYVSHAVVGWRSLVRGEG